VIDLTRHQFLIMTAYGIALWFAAAMLCSWIGPMGVYDGMARALLYAAVVVGTVPFLFLGTTLAGLARHQILAGFAVADAAALLLDGLAVAWLPGLYGDTPELVLGASAVILWGAGIVLVLAAAMNRRAPVTA